MLIMTPGMTRVITSTQIGRGYAMTRNVAVVVTMLLYTLFISLISPRAQDQAAEAKKSGTIPAGKHLAKDVDIKESSFLNVNMSGVEFNDVNMKSVSFSDINLNGASFHDINMSDIKIHAVQMGGAHFKHIGLPPGSEGKQRPLLFEEANLPGTTFQNCDLTDVKIVGCKVEGMVIDGIPFVDLLAAYKAREND